MSEKAAKLPYILKYKGMKEYFKKKGYVTSFKMLPRILNPVMFRNIYKGALGEVAGRFIIENELGIKLIDITEPEKFEKFDFRLNEEVYVDFKNWDESMQVDRENELKKIRQKMRMVGANACVYPRFDGIGGELLLLKADKELDKEQMIDALLHFKEDSPELVKKNKEDFEKFLNNLKNKEEEYVDKKAFYKDIGRGKLREGFNEYLRAEYRILLNFSKSKENLPLYDLDAMTDIHYSISGDSSGELVKYFVGSAKALNGSVARSNPIRKIIGKTLKAEEILPMLTATFVRNEQYTVIPFPYKYIREYFQVS